MSNVNSVADVILQQNNGQPITLASTKTIHQSFQLGSSAALLTLPNPLALVDAAQPFPGRAAQAIPFLIRAAGTVIGGEQFQIDIVQGTGLTPVVATTGLDTQGRVNDNWYLEASCMWDSASLFLRGMYRGWVGNVTFGWLPLAGTPISPANLASLQFNVAVTIASANANASFSLTEFSAELL